jgi:hypothetical protein
MEIRNDFGCNANTRWFAILMGLILMILCLTGCQSAYFHEGDYVGQGLKATADIPPTPGAVVSTHEDGTVTVEPIPVAPAPTPAVAPPVRPVRPTTIAATEAPARSPVVAVTVIQPTPGKSFSYTITPESQKGDVVGASRMVTWAGEAPGTVVEKVATQKEKRTHNPLPAVTVDETGIHATKGGGSTDAQAGQSWWQQICTWVSDTLKGWAWWLVVIGIGVAAFFILPILVPALAPLFASIAGAFHGAWEYITGEIGKLFAWFKTIHLSKASVSTGAATSPAPSSPSAMPAAISPTLASPAATPAQVPAPDSPVVAEPSAAIPGPANRKWLNG